LRLLAWLARRLGYQVIVGGLGLTTTRPMSIDDFLRAVGERDDFLRAVGERDG
jgi:hypothetical protein